MPDEAETLLEAAMESRANFHKLQKESEDSQTEEDQETDDVADKNCADGERSVEDPVTDDSLRT